MKLYCSVSRFATKFTETKALYALDLVDVKIHG